MVEESPRLAIKPTARNPPRTDGDTSHRCLGSRASRRPSPMKLKQNRVTARNVAGKISSQGALSICAAPSAISTPQLVSGSCTLRPRNDRNDSIRITWGHRERDVDDHGAEHVRDDVASDDLAVADARRTTRHVIDSPGQRS
jgi:hypothetical protein